MEMLGKVVSFLMNVPMGSGTTARWYNGLIQGGVAIAILWWIGAVTF